VGIAEPNVRVIGEHNIGVIDEERIGRFLMNALLASGGYQWTIIHLDARTQYMKALEKASTAGIILDFASVVADEMIRTEVESPELRVQE